MKLLIKENYWFDFIFFSSFPLSSFFPFLVLLFCFVFVFPPPVSELLSPVTDTFRVYDEIRVTCLSEGRLGILDNFRV